MPTPYLRKVSKETGIPMNKLEQNWDKAKRQAGTDDWALITSIFQRITGLHENLNQLNKLSTIQRLKQFLKEHTK